MEPVNGQPKEPCGLVFRDLRRLDDPELIVHLKAGHNDALAVLFERYHRLVLSVALKILRDPSEAEDVMQSIFLEIYRVAGHFDPARGSVKIWLLQYAYHRSMNRREYLRVRGFYAREQAGSRPGNAAEGASGETVTGLPLLPEVRCMVREGLETLNHSQKSVLHMAYFEDMPLKDIAVKTGQSLGTVRHHYYRALHRLRALLAGGEVQSHRHAQEAKFEIAAQGSIDVEI